jgi:predicted PurR-regulated permease PerM
METVAPLATAEPPASFKPGGAIATVLIGVVVIAAVYFGREVLVPVALAVLMSFVLAPIVRFFQHLRVPRSIAVLGVVIVAFTGILALGGLIVSQVNQLAIELPRYQSTLRDKIHGLRGIAGGGTFDRAADVLQDLGREIDRPRSGPLSPALTGEPTDKPIPVEVRQPDPGALKSIASLIAPLVSPLATGGIVVIFVIFILLQREDLRNRFVRLAGAHDLQRTTMALDDAGRRLSRLFLTQLGLNAGFGLVIGAGLWVIGVPSAPLWGVLAAILRFVPYIGPVIGAVFPLLLAAAVGPGWSMVLWTGLLFVVVEPIVGHIIEPLLYGHTSGMSPIAVVASATFWTWLWGPIGLVLATPLTICLVVLGRHVDRLKFLDVMLGDEPALAPAELAYQRMLAGDAVEPIEQARSVLKQRPLFAYYEEVLIPALRLAQSDAERGDLHRDRQGRIRDAVAELVDDLSTHEDQPEPTSEPDDVPKGPLAALTEAEESSSPRAEPALPDRWRTGRPVLCVPGGGPLDEAAAIILAQLLTRAGVGAAAEQADALSMNRIFALPTEGVEIVCVCYVENATAAKVRYALRRLGRKFSSVPMFVCALGETAAAAEAKIASLPPAEFFGRSLGETVDMVHAAAREAARQEQQAASGVVREVTQTAA